MLLVPPTLCLRIAAPRCRRLPLRLFSDAVAEVAAWLAAPGNEAEFIVLYLDDQVGVGVWGGVGQRPVEGACVAVWGARESAGVRGLGDVCGRQTMS